MDGSTVIATHLSQLLKNNAAKLIGQDDVQQLLERLKQTAPKLVENLVPNTMSLADVTRVVHSLLDEGVPIRDMRTKVKHGMFVASVSGVKIIIRSIML